MTSPTGCASHPVGAQRFQKPRGILRSYGKQKPAGGLRVEKQVPDVFRNARGKLHAAADEFQVSLQTTGKKTFLRELARFRQKLNLRRVDGEAHFAAHRHFPRVAEQAEARDVRGGVHFKR